MTPIIDLNDALTCLAERGGDLAPRFRLDFGPQAVEAVRALRFRSHFTADASPNGHTKIRPPLLVGIVGGASSGKSTVFNNILGGRPASRVSAKGHSTRGPILALHDQRHVAMQSALDRRLLLPAFRHQSISLDANVDGETDLLCVVRHHRGDLQDVLLFDMPDFTSEPARLEGDIALACLPWFDRILVLVDNERLFDRQTIQRMRDESEQFAQERVVLFNRVATSRLTDAERDRLAQQAERLGAAEFHVIDDRPGRGLCAIPPAMLEPILGALRRACSDRSPNLLRFVAVAADRALNQNDHRARRLGQLRESLFRAVAADTPARFECMAALMTADEKRHLDLLWRTLRWTDTRRWFQTGVDKIGRAIRRNIPLIGPLLAPGGSVEPLPLDPTDRQANGWELFRRASRRQADAARQAAQRSDFWEEVRRWTDAEPPTPALNRVDAARSDVAARVAAFEAALRRWSEKVQSECRGLSPHVVGAMGGGALAGFIVLAAVSGPIGALTWGAAKVAISGALGTLAASAGAGAMAGKPFARFMSVVQERLLGSDEYLAVQTAADRFRECIATAGHQIADDQYESARAMVLAGDDPLHLALAAVSDAAREPG